MLIRTTPACSPETEALVTRIIGCALRVHQALGPGYTEGLYHDAMAIDLALEGLRFEREVTIRVTYRGQPLRPQRLDLVVEGEVVVELKAVERLDRIHQAQLMSYLKAGGFKGTLDELPLGVSEVVAPAFRSVRLEAFTKLNSS